MTANDRLLSWLAVAVALTGNVFVIQENVLGFWLWIWANGLFIFLHGRARQWPQVVLFSVYLILAIYGVWEWGYRG